MIDLATSRFRANPAYELVPGSRLSARERAELRALGADDDFSDLLRSRERPTQRIKAICQQTADLYLSMIEPRALPDDLRPALGARFRQTIAQLVLDDILEVEHDGRFVSGPEAHPLLSRDVRDGGDDAAGGRLARLSVRALQYADALDIVDSPRLCARLYFYNRMPATPDLARRLSDGAAVEAYLGVSPQRSSDATRSAVTRLLDRAWVRRDSDQAAAWIAWQHVSPRALAARPMLTWKLYVSPAIDDLPDAFAATLQVLTDRGVPSFKVGCDLHGLLRPDKLVAYFPSREDLQDTIELLARALAGCRAQGVPFTADAGGDGLLSWGIDPPLRTNAFAAEASPARPESWRAWVTSRLAAALLSAKAAEGDGACAMPAWSFALERVRLEGVDTHTWSPSSSIWIDGAETFLDGD
jgi:hypothetical protein